MNEQELSIMIADQELEELNEYKKLCYEIQKKEKSTLSQVFILQICTSAFLDSRVV
jgi:hypothetical protein